MPRKSEAGPIGPPIGMDPRHYKAKQHHRKASASSPQAPPPIGSAPRQASGRLEAGQASTLPKRASKAWLKAMEAVSWDGRDLESLSSFQDDRDIVLAAVRQDWRAIEFASERLQHDRHIMLEAVSQRWGGEALQYAPSHLRGDRDLAATAVKQDGQALQYVSDMLRADREIVLAAITHHGSAMEHASLELRGDRDLVRAAVQLPAGFPALEFISPELQADEDFLQEVVNILPAGLRCVLLRVSMLSGRSCIVVYDFREINFLEDAADDRRNVLLRCARHFGVADEQLDGAELLLGDAIIPQQRRIDKWPGIERGRLNNLQLVLQQSSSAATCSEE
mmetsp:Transcript_7544/g.16624  ORF Transcript_7544/g.16624 Transcript_7544/m.16624 type:complete len:336 (-) Transcript_7544:8-1015(-)